MLTTLPISTIFLGTCGLLLFALAIRNRARSSRWAQVDATITGQRGALVGDAPDWIVTLRFEIGGNVCVVEEVYLGLTQSESQVGNVLSVFVDTADPTKIELSNFRLGYLLPIAGAVSMVGALAILLVM